VPEKAWARSRGFSRSRQNLKGIEVSAGTAYPYRIPVGKARIPWLRDEGQEQVVAAPFRATSSRRAKARRYVWLRHKESRLQPGCLKARIQELKGGIEASAGPPYPYRIPVGKARLQRLKGGEPLLGVAHLFLLRLWPVVLEDQRQIDMIEILDDANDASPEAYISLFYPLRP